MVSTPDRAPESASRSGLRRPAMISCALIAWSIVVIGGTATLWQYSMQPGQASFAVTSWPEELDFTHAPDAHHRFTLAMVVHPKCPCTRASLQELAKIMRYASQPVDAMVLVSRPEGTPAGFERTDIWTQAAQVPGVEVKVDPGGEAARALGLLVSGATAVYDMNGQMLFSGGVTSARGHAGDNGGSDAIIGILSGRSTDFAHTPVYGCPLFSQGASCEIPDTGQGAHTCCR